MIQLAVESWSDVSEELKDIETTRREADAFILYMENRQSFREVQCKQCHNHFAVDYQSVAMCSDKCRIEFLRNIGVEWNPLKSQSERWAGRIPLTLQPDAFVLAKSLEHLEI